MTTRYEFGYGDGEIYRRRMQGQEEMHRRMTERAGRLSEEDQQRSRYESDYYGFRGAGSRGGQAAESSAGRRSGGRMRDGGRRGGRSRKAKSRADD